MFFFVLSRVAISESRICIYRLYLWKLNNNKQTSYIHSNEYRNEWSNKKSVSESTELCVCMYISVCVKKSIWTDFINLIICVTLYLTSVSYFVFVCVSVCECAECRYIIATANWLYHYQYNLLSLSWILILFSIQYLVSIWTERRRITFFCAARNLVSKVCFLFHMHSYSLSLVSFSSQAESAWRNVILFRIFCHRYFLPALKSE